MNDKYALSNNYTARLFTCAITLIVTLLKVASVLSAPTSSPLATGATGYAPSEGPIVINKPIFAPPKGGGLLLTTGTNNADRIVLVAEARQFRVVFPPGRKDGRFSILRIAKTVDDTAVGLKPRHWYKIHSLGTTSAKLTVDWNAAVNSAIAAPKPIRAADISMNTLTGKTIIAAGSALLAGGRGIGRGRIPLEQMVLDFRLKNGAKERIQFLPTPPQNKIVLLGPSTPSSVTPRIPPYLVATGARPQLSLTLESFQMRRRRRFHVVESAKSANRRINAVWYNLTSRPTLNGRPAAVKLSCLIFGFVHGKLINNYSHEVQLIPAMTARLNTALQFILEQQNRGAAGLGPDLRKLKAVLAIIAARDKRLQCLRLLSLGMELYPGGPVLETITYEKPGIAAQPAGRSAVPIRPALKKHLSPGF